MATIVLKDAFVSVNGVDLSDHVKSVELPAAVEMLDDTVMGDDTRSNKPGLKTWNITVNFVQDFASAKVDATLFPLLGAAAFTLIVRADNAAGVGATNPNYTGSAVLESYPPLGNQVGELAMSQAVFQSAGTLTRATS